MGSDGYFTRKRVSKDAIPSRKGMQLKSGAEMAVKASGWVALTIMSGTLFWSLASYCVGTYGEGGAGGI